MSKRVGIIGAGQLGAYLCQAAKAIGFESTILTPDEHSPASTLASEMLVANYDDLDALKTLCEKSDVVTFEFEDVPDASLRFLEEQDLAKVFPRPATIRLLQNKGLQKSWLRDNHFETSDFVLCPHEADYQTLAQRLGPKFVQKALMGGFDGRGVQVINETNAAELWQDSTLAEAFVVHDLELAVLVSRNVSGAVSSYPVVELSFSSKANILLLANSPARISKDIEQQAKAMAEQLVTAMSGVGVFAIELFLTPEGKLLVNEISPRVHNSGHMTIEAHETNQYEQHLRAVFDMPLGSQQQLLPVAMTNLLYDEHLSIFLGRTFSDWSFGAHSNIHWYGKLEGRLGRKMGHVTTTAETLDAAIDEAQIVQTKLQHNPEDAA